MTNGHYANNNWQYSWPLWPIVLPFIIARMAISHLPEWPLVICQNGHYYCHLLLPECAIIIARMCHLSFARMAMYHLPIMAISLLPFSIAIVGIIITRVAMLIAIYGH